MTEKLNYNLNETNCELNNGNEDVDEDNREDNREDGIDDQKQTEEIGSGNVLNHLSNTEPTNEPKIGINSENTNRLESIDENGSEELSTSMWTTDSQWAANSSLTPYMRDRFRRKLRYYFMSPIDKWRAKRRLPFKLCIQVIKIILITSQLMIFGFDMSNHLSQESNAIISFREIFLSNWDPVREVMAYPPAAGPFAVYTKEDFYSSVDFAIKQFSNISELSIGSFGYAINRTQTHRNMSDIIVRRKHYRTGTCQPSDYTFIYDSQEVTDILKIGELYPPNDSRWLDFTSYNYFESNNFSINFDRLLLIELVFPLRTIYLNSLAKYNAPKCYDLNVSIVFDNTEHDGQMPVQLITTTTKHICDGNLANNDDDDNERVRRQVLNWAVIIFSTISTLLCIRSLYSGQVLRRETEQVFSRHFEKELTFGEQMDFIDFWIVMIVINDILILSGTIIKMDMESQLEDNFAYTTVSVLLGTGNLFVWTGLLRYLGFFHKYNILILTLRRAVPNVLRFMLCALLLYGGFCFCGWVVLGPYHLKFRTLSRASECLFSLMNGDDMFATFYITDARQEPVIWWFSRIYLYLFVCLFIYVVLSLFIALIMDSYETIKDYYENGLPLSNLQKFISECTDLSSSRAYLEDRQTSIADTFNLCFDCLNRRSNNYNDL